MNEIAVGAAKHISRKKTSARTVFVVLHTGRPIIEHIKSTLRKSDIHVLALQSDA